LLVVPNNRALDKLLVDGPPILSNSHVPAGKLQPVYRHITMVSVISSSRRVGATITAAEPKDNRSDLKRKKDSNAIDQKRQC
jgi:hypothetical protein